MKRLFSIILTMSLIWVCTAQAGSSDAPTTKEDVQKYLQVMYGDSIPKKMAASVVEGTQQWIHESYTVRKNQLPADYESMMTGMITDMFEKTAWDEMIQEMLPVFQTRYTHSDMNNLIAFYSSPTGQKMLKENPEIISSLQKITTSTMAKYSELAKGKLKQETDDLARPQGVPQFSSDGYLRLQ